MTQPMDSAKRDARILLEYCADSGLRVGRHHLCGWVEEEGKPRRAGMKLLSRFGGHCWQTFATAARKVFGEEVTLKKAPGGKKTSYLKNVRLKGKLVL